MKLKKNVLMAEVLYYVSVHEYMYLKRVMLLSSMIYVSTYNKHCTFKVTTPKSLLGDTVFAVTAFLPGCVSLRGGIVGQEVDRLEGVVRAGQNVNKCYYNIM